MNTLADSPSTDLAERRAATETVAALGDDVPAAVAWAADVGRWAPKPGRGHTLALWRLLAETAMVDVGVARIAEPHLDALAILDQAPSPVPLSDIGADAASTWGVYASESGEGRLSARDERGTWVLDGVKPWCSLAQNLSHALVTARRDDGRRALFAVDLRSPGVTPAPGPWVARGLRQVVSAPVRFERVRAVPVGDPGWYWERPGFSWGGIGVAACWFGGAVGVSRALFRAGTQRDPDQLTLVHLGAVDSALTTADAALAAAAETVDTGQTREAELPVLMLRTRSIVASAAEAVLTHVAHALGPAPLALDEQHARHVADLDLYLRQHHAERDDAALGRALLDRGPGFPW